MNLEGKIIDFLGDSITEGYLVLDRENNRYDSRVKKHFKLKEAYNYGLGGTRLAHQHEADIKPRHDLCFCGRAYDMNPDADLIVVFGGTNDYGHGDAPVGQATDKTPDTFYGAVDFLINILAELYPKAKVVFMTPAHRVGDEKPSVRETKKSDALPLKGYCEIIKQKCGEYNIPVLDLYEELGINPNNEEDKVKYVPDGLHYNDEGHRFIAERLIKFLEDLD